MAKCRWHGTFTLNEVSSDSLREMFDSNACWLKFAPPVVVGLVNWNEVGCSSRSAVTLLIDPGQAKVYGTPSKSPSISKHPLIFTASDFPALLAVYAGEPFCHDPKLRGRLHRVTVPVLVLAGEPDGILPLE